MDNDTLELLHTAGGGTCCIDASADLVRGLLYCGAIVALSRLLMLLIMCYTDKAAAAAVAAVAWKAGRKCSCVFSCFSLLAHITTPHRSSPLLTTI